MTFLLFAAALCGCKKQNTSTGHILMTISVDRSDKIVSNEFDALFEYKNHVLLETNEASLLGRINKIHLTEDEIYIMNDRTKITVFKKDGAYVRTISHVGHGPGEYVKLMDFDVRDGVLYCLDGNKILKYNLTGNYIESINLENASQGICVLNHGIALNNGFGFSNDDTKDNFSYTFFDKKHKTLNMLRFNETLTGLIYTVDGQVCKFSRRGDKALAFFPFNDTIYRIDDINGRIEPLVNARIGERNITAHMAKKDVDRILASDCPRVLHTVDVLGDKIMLTYVQEFPKTVVSTIDGSILINGIVTEDKKWFSGLNIRNHHII